MPSEKKLEQKKKQVDQLVKELQSAESIVLTDYKGLTVAQDTAMRADFREQGLTYRVVKNSITTRAFEKLGISGLDETLVGPTALAYSSEDVVLAPRLIRKYADKYRKMSIKGGVVGSEVYPLEHIMALSRIESRENLYGQLLFMMLYPLTAFAQVSAQIAEKGTEQGVEKVADLVTEKVAQEVAEQVEETIEPGVEEAPTEKPEEEVNNG